MSPLVWNLSFDSVLSLFDNTDVKAYGFANDLALLVTGKNYRHMAKTMQLAINNAVSWGKAKGLSFSCLLYTSDAADE